MGTFRRPDVRNLLRCARRRRTALVLLVAATAVVLVGSAWPRSAMDVVTAADPTGPASALQGQRQNAGQIGRRMAAEEVTYVEPEPAILAAFLACVPPGGVEPAFVPAEVPTGSRLVPRPPISGDDGDASARRGPTVVLSAQGGYLAFYDALDESFTHLPGTPCGLVGGRPAVARRVLGGESVQWEAGGVLHAVFGWNLSRAVVTRVASGMRPMNAVDDAAQIAVRANCGRRIRE